MNDAYIIQRYIWDINYPSKEKVYALQTRFSRLFDHAAVPIMEAVFHDHVSPGRLVRLDTLELDLGVLDAALIERDFPERFRAALVKALLERVGPVHLAEGPAGGATAGGGVAGSAELLEYFLLEGILPWWATSRPEDAPQRLLERLCAEAPGHLAPLLLRTGQFAYVRRRLAYQFPDSALGAAVGLIAPGEGTFIAGYHATVVRAQQTTRWVAQETASFARELWLFILTFLLKDMAGHFNRRAFVRQTLMDMASHYSIPYPDLLALFSEALRQTTARFQDQDALQKIIRELTGQWEDDTHPLESDTVDTFHSEVLDLEKKLTWLSAYLLGKSPEGDTYDPAALPGILTGLFARLPSTLRHTLSGLGRAEAVQERIADTFGDPGLRIVVRLEEPAHAEFILDYATRIQTAQRLRAEPGSLRKVVWTLILSYLWNEKGSIFNTRTFLERQIHALGYHYRISYGDMLSLLVGDQAVEWAGLEPSTLFHLLSDIWQEYVRSPEGPSAVATGAVETHPEAIALFQALMRLLQALGALDAGVPGAGLTIAAWDRALPLLKGVALQDTGASPPWTDAMASGGSFDAGRFMEAALRWLSGKTGLEPGALTSGLALAAIREAVRDAPESGNARALRYLLQGLAPGPAGAQVQALSPGVGRLITSWLSSPKRSDGIQGDPRLEATLQSWMGKRHPRWDKRTLAFMQDLRRLFLSVLPGTAERDGFEALFLECAILFLGDRYGSKDPQAFAIALLSFMEGRRKTSPAFFMALLRASGSSHRFSLDGTPFFPAFRALVRSRLPAERAPDATPTARQRIALEVAQTLQKEQGRRDKKKPVDGLYIHNAGMVLLHPLLPTLFNRLEWLDKGKFVGDAAQHRAVHLLQYLVFGNREASPPEQDLVLNKLLCGLIPGDPVPLEVVLTEAEKSLGEELLRAVLQHWTKLGNTSPDGLRLSFLQRNGSLAETPEAWTLRVEQRGIDVLLPFLPWGMGLIKTSWMLKTLHVEWT